MLKIIATVGLLEKIIEGILKKGYQKALQWILKNKVATSHE
jgi:hypothetical protein